MADYRIGVTGCAGRMGQMILREVLDHPDCKLGAAHAVDVSRCPTDAVEQRRTIAGGEQINFTRVIRVGPLSTPLSYYQL